MNWLFWKTINKKKYATVSEKTSKLEVIATVVFRCFDFDRKHEHKGRKYYVLICWTLADGEECLLIGLKFCNPTPKRCQ